MIWGFYKVRHCIIKFIKHKNSPFYLFPLYNIGKLIDNNTYVLKSIIVFFREQYLNMGILDCWKKVWKMVKYYI